MLSLPLWGLRQDWASFPGSRACAPSFAPALTRREGGEERPAPVSHLTPSFAQSSGQSSTVLLSGDRGWTRVLPSAHVLCPLTLVLPLPWERWPLAHSLSVEQRGHVIQGEFSASQRNASTGGVIASKPQTCYQCSAQRSCPLPGQRASYGPAEGVLCRPLVPIGPGGSRSDSP